jgi:hypothetical protein
VLQSGVVVFTGTHEEYAATAAADVFA